MRDDCGCGAGIDDIVVAGKMFLFNFILIDFRFVNGVPVYILLPKISVT